MHKNNSGFPMKLDASGPSYKFTVYRYAFRNVFSLLTNLLYFKKKKTEFCTNENLERFPLIGKNVYKTKTNRIKIF